MLLTTHVELDELSGGRKRNTIHVRPIGYRQNGSLLRSVTDWVDGDATFPHVISRAPMLVYTAADGMRRICPTRDPLRYVEIGRPYIKPATNWTGVNLGTPTRSGNTLTWTTANAIAKVVMAGHYIDLSCEFKGGWLPPNNQIAFPVGMSGLTRTGSDFYADGVKVLTLRPFQMYDAANPQDVRAVDTQLVKVGSTWYALATLPSVAGMSRPVLDPTLTLQPDAADGIDTMLLENHADTNYGANEAMITRALGVSGRVSLTKFDLSSIPPGSTPTAGVMYIETLYGWWGDGVHSFARVLAANAGWTEADATWNHADGVADWAGGHNGCSVSGTDYSATAMGTFTWPVYDGAHDNIQLTSSAFDLTELAAMIAANYGMAHYSAIASGASFASSDHATAAWRPKLVIDYTLPVSGGGLLTRGVG